MTTIIRKIFLLPALAAVCAGIFSSCGEDRWKEYEEETAVDTWMHRIMQEHYLWYQELPSYKKVNPFLDPAAFLTKIKSEKDKYSFVNELRDTPAPTYGFKYSLVKDADSETNYNALVTYVIPGSPAERAGLQRGNWIMQADGRHITKKEEEELLQGTRAMDLTMGSWQEVTPEAEEGTEPVKVWKVAPNGKTVRLGAAETVEDNPVHAYKILTVASVGKVGYLMYNSFTAGTKAEPQKYNDLLRKISREFREAEVKATILDLRHNTGGTPDCVQLLGTILAPESRLGTSMAYLEYNDKQSEKNREITLDREVLKGGVNLNQQLLFVITSGETTGMAEMLISGLYRENEVPAIITIGSATKGQNMATESFANEELRWAVNPVVCAIYRPDKKTTYGPISPASDFVISETSIDGKTDYSRYLPFGNPEERLLNIALETLAGNYPPPKEEK